MSIPAEAFVHGEVGRFAAGQMFTQQGIWWMLTDAQGPHGRRTGIALNGPMIGQLVFPLAQDKALAIAPSFKVRPLLASLPSPTAPVPGSLFFSPAGPMVRSWFENQMVYAFDFAGSDRTVDFPHDAVAISTWSMGLFLNEGADAPLCELFTVNVAPVAEAGSDTL